MVMATAELLKGYKRVVYENAPLIEVVAQIRFPIQLTIEQREPAEFQVKILDAFPILKLSEGFQLTWPVLRGQFQTPRRARSYIFVNAASNTEVTLTADSITLSSRAYTEWSDFSGTLFTLLSQFIGAYPAVKHRERVSLRYRNLISPTRLGLSDTKIQDLVKPEYLGLMASGALPDASLKFYNTFCQLAIEEVGIFIQCMKVQSTDARDELAIDFEYSIEGAEIAPWSDVEMELNRLHSFSGPLFKSCLTDRLHDALTPKP
jgi:uncharacterized protein (TIGR04255 family)